MGYLKVDFAYQWEPVLVDVSREYRFPEEITPYMKKIYWLPTIYRWNIFRNELSDEKLVYIGEAQELCPQRINNYLNAHPSQKTNWSIKEKFQNYLKNGLKIGLEFLQFEEIKFEDFILTYNDLQDKHVREFLQDTMIVLSKKLGFKVLNK